MREDLLVKAALLKGDAALEAWELFVKNNPLNGHPKLFPLIYYNLAIRQKLEAFSEIETLRNLYLTTHAKNLYLLNSLKLPLSKLAEKQIPLIALKGLAYLPLYYKNLGARLMTDIDLLVPENHLHEAAHVLEDLGWKPFRCRQLKHFNPRLMHALDYFDLLGNNIDLHCHLLHTNCEKSANDPYWDAAIEFNWNGIRLQTLCPTDHLIQACAHAQISNSAHSMYWASDALCILEQGVNWERIVSLARAKAISPFLLESFQRLKSYVPTSIPDSVIIALQAIPITHLDQRIFRLLQVQEKKLSYHQYLLCNAYRNCKDKSRLSTFAEYLKLIASADRLTLVPFTLSAKIIQKSFSWVKRFLFA